MSAESNEDSKWSQCKCLRWHAHPVLVEITDAMSLFSAFYLSVKPDTWVPIFTLSKIIFIEPMKNQWLVWGENTQTKFNEVT